MAVRRAVFLLLAALTLTTHSHALGQGLRDMLPRDMEEAEQEEILPNALARLWDGALETIADALRRNLRGAAELVLVALVCALAAPFEREGPRIVPLLGVLAAASLTAGGIGTMIALGAQTVEELGTLGKLLLPGMAAALAAGGMVSAAGVWQVTTLLVSDLFGSLMRRVLLPLIYCYIGAAAAEAVLGDGRLEALCTAAEKLISWGLTALTLGFTAYLKLTSVLSGSADRAAVKAAKGAVSALVPVIGSVLSDAAESVLAGASALRGTIGAMGVVSILTLCLAPLVRLGVQFVLYKAAAFAAGLVGIPEIRKFLDRLGTAFSLVLAMTAAQGALLLAAMLVAATMISGG